MTIKERFKLTIEYFLKNNPDAETELTYQNPFELMVAVSFQLNALTRESI